MLLELHRYAQTQDELKDRINFYPCGQPDTKGEGFDSERLLRLIGYGQCLGADTYNSILGSFLKGANLRRADLRGANLNGANFSGANLSKTILWGALLMGTDLSQANLWEADLWGADLGRANLTGANLTQTKLRGADLRELKWDKDTKWANAEGLHEAVGVPLELAQQPAFSAAVSLSQGMNWVREGKVEDAIQAYEQAQTIDPNLQISAQSWNTLCWYGCLHGYASQVLLAGEKAMKLEPDNKGYQHSRGLARGFTGDLAGAKEDVQALLNSGYFDVIEEWKQRRERWVEVLEAGENPFTPEELQALRRDYSLSDE